ETTHVSVLGLVRTAVVSHQPWIPDIILAGNERVTVEVTAHYIRHHRLEHGNVDALPLAGPRSRVERRGNDAESVEAYRAVGDRQRHITRFAFSLLPHYRGQP